MKKMFESFKEYFISENVIDENIITEMKLSSVQRIEGFSSESNMYLIMIEKLVNHPKFAKVMINAGKDILTGGNIKNIHTVMFNEFTKLINKEYNLFSELLEIYNKKYPRFRINPEWVDKDLLNNTIATTISFGVINDFNENPLQIAKELGDKKLIELADDFVVDRGKGKLSAMMGGMKNLKGKSFESLINETKAEEYSEEIDWTKVSEKKLPVIPEKLQLEMISLFPVQKKSGKVVNITPNFNNSSEHDDIFGDYMDNEKGILQEKYPEWFDDKVVKQYFKSTAPQYGRQLMFLMLCRDNVYYYGREKREFYEWEGWKLAEESGKKYLYMENLS